jgi:ubiquinone/menaquinone biosynthesis C-methylase UbiE
MDPISAKTGRKAKDAGMEGWVAGWYARTRGHDLADFQSQAALVAQLLAPGASVLEVAPGPGYFAVELAKLGNYSIVGLDISHTFVEMAARNAEDAHVAVAFRQGNVAAMPFEADSFDFVYCSAAFKNFAAPVTALDEMHRVLRPGGQAMIVDLRKDVPLDRIETYVKQSGRRRFDAWMTTMAFRHMLIKRAYTKAEFVAMAETSRFGGCRIIEGEIGLDIRLTKTKPS